MGSFTIDSDETIDQEYLKQNIDMLIGRTKTVASVIRNINSGVIKAISLDSPNFSTEELGRMWEAIKSANPSRAEILIRDDSPLRHLRDDFSREQALIFDGIRYAAEMADIAYWRLFDLLQEISSLNDSALTTRQIATAMLDAWSIVDSVNRLRDLLGNAPGVRHEIWWKLFIRRTHDIDALRNDVQHQTGELNSLVANTGQIWGFLSWAEVRQGRYTGQWHMMSPGAVYSGDQWIFEGPALPSAPLPFGRIRLHAYGRDVYLGKIIKAVHEVIAELAAGVQNGSVRPSGSPAIGRNGGDVIYASSTEVLLNDNTKAILMPDVGI